MWHAARKQEKKVRETMIDFQKRAERRREHYEKLRGDPHQLLRINGNRCKMHLNPKKSGELDASMIPWQGDTDNMISRYDVRIHLDYIPDKKRLPTVELSREEAAEESRCNYERYRTLVQNVFHDLSEEGALKQIEVEEMYPKKQKGLKAAKEKSRAKAAIGFSYSGEGGGHKGGQEEEGERELSSDSEYEVDMDVDSFTSGQVDRLNVLALDYGIPAGAFSKTLRKEKTQLEEQKQARMMDKEKANLSGRKSRKERQQIKDHQSIPRLPTPPSYARRDSPTYEPYKEEEKRDESSSRSSSSEPEGKVEFITEFGEHSESETTNQIKTTSSQVPSAEPSQREDRKRRRSYSRDRNDSRSRHRGQRSPSPRRRRSRDGRSRHHSRRSYSRTPSPKRRSSHRRRRSYSRDRHRRRSRSRSPYHRRRSRSRSPYQHRGSRHRRGSRSPRRRQSHSKNRRSRSRSPRRRSRSDSDNHRQHRKSRSSSSSSSSSDSSSPNERQRSRSASPVPNKRRSSSKSVSRSHSRSPETHSTDRGEEDRAKSEVTKAKLTPQERLMRRMQAQLNKQFKMDKKNQQKKQKIKEAEKMEREELLREQMKKIKDSRADRPEYEISSKGEMYSDQPSRSPSPPSPVRDLLASAVKKDPAEFYYGRFM